HSAGYVALAPLQRPWTGTGAGQAIGRNARRRDRGDQRRRRTRRDLHCHATGYGREGEWGVGSREWGAGGGERTRLSLSHSPLAHSPRPSSHSSALPLTSVGVLIVDDEEDARTLVSKVLEESGAYVVAVSSAVEAFAMITEPPRPDWPDVLVCDIGMPEEDGYSLMRRIRDWERERGFHLPSVALTSLNRAEDRMNALVAGYKMHIAKPFEAEEVITVVKNLARGRQENGRSSKKQ